MKSHSKLKIILTLTSLYLSTTSIFASELAIEAEQTYNKTYEYYCENYENLTPSVLEKIKSELKRVIVDNHSPNKIIIDAACLLCFLDRNSPYIRKAMNTLFNRPDFDPVLYKIFKNEIRRLKAEKAAENGK